MSFLRRRPMQLKLFLLAVILPMLMPMLSPAADSPAPAQLMLSQTAAQQAGNVLTLDEALQIALENHPSIKASPEATASGNAGARAAINFSTPGKIVTLF